MFKSYKTVLCTIAISFLVNSAYSEKIELGNKDTYPMIMWNNVQSSATKELRDHITGAEAI